MTTKLKSQKINGLLIQTGEGYPTHTSTVGAIYYDLLTNYEYKYTPTRWILKTEVLEIVEVNMKDTVGTIYTLLPQQPGMLFVPSGLSLVVTEMSGSPSIGAMTFNMDGGPSHHFTFGLTNQN
jgi:hypothetical protein